MDCSKLLTQISTQLVLLISWLLSIKKFTRRLLLTVLLAGGEERILATCRHSTSDTISVDCVLMLLTDECTGYQCVSQDILHLDGTCKKTYNIHKIEYKNV